jgi:predicted nucleic acid-binding protein
MLPPDVHVLVHAHDADSAVHAAARRWWDDCLAGNLTTDAHLAVLAMERGYVLYSTDADFARFPALRWVNPCPR